METDTGIRENHDQPAQAYQTPGWLRSTINVLYHTGRLRLAELLHWKPAQGAKLRVEVSASEILLFNSSQTEPVARLQYHNTFSTPVPSQESLSACELILNSELGLTTTVTFPAEAEAMLGSLIGMMLERYIPFREEEIHFDYRITGRAGAKGEIAVKIYAVPRATMERVLEHLAGLGLTAVTVDMLETSTDSTKRAGINLLRQADERGNLPRRKLNRVMLLAALLFLMAAATIPVYQRYFPAQHQKEFKTMHMSPRDSKGLHDDANGNNGTLRINLERTLATPHTVSM